MTPLLVRPVRHTASLEERTAAALARLEAEVDELVESWCPPTRPRAEPIRFVPVPAPELPPRPALFAAIPKPKRRPKARPPIPESARERPLPPTLRLVWRLRRRGLRPGAIALALGVTPSAVSVAWSRATAWSEARMAATLAATPCGPDDTPQGGPKWPGIGQGPAGATDAEKYPICGRGDLGAYLAPAPVARRPPEMLKIRLLNACALLVGDAEIPPLMGREAGAVPDVVTFAGISYVQATSVAFDRSKLDAVYRAASHCVVERVRKDES